MLSKNRFSFRVAHELGDGLSGNGCEEILGFAFFSQRRKLEPPGERLVVHAWRVQCALDNGLPNTALKTLPVLADSTFEGVQHREDDGLPKRGDLAWVAAWLYATMKLAEEPTKAERN